MRDIGGPAQLTAYLRGLDDTLSRMDQYEPGLNRNPLGDPRDTTTPELSPVTITRSCSVTRCPQISDLSSRIGYGATLPEQVASGQEFQGTGLYRMAITQCPPRHRDHFRPGRMRYRGHREIHHLRSQIRAFTHTPGPVLQPLLSHYPLVVTGVNARTRLHGIPDPLRSPHVQSCRPRRIRCLV